MIQIILADNGTGIKKENKNKLFKLFGSIKDEHNKINYNKINFQGIGLGLVISKVIIEKFG